MGNLNLKKISRILNNKIWQNNLNNISIKNIKPKNPELPKIE